VEIRFSRAALRADVAFFYCSGHAMQFAGINYRMPADANLKRSIRLTPVTSLH
jgi:uncharacterized caspase-like protein